MNLILTLTNFTISIRTLTQ